VDPVVIRDFAIALFIGALIGIEREKRKVSDVGLGGIRTFILLAIAGSVSAWLSLQLGAPWVFAVTVLVAAAFVLAGYAITVGAGVAQPGLTTEVAALVTVLLGGLVMFGWPSLAVGLGITTSAVLAFKAPLHGLVARLGEEDIYAGLKLLVATFIVLPLLPNRTIDPLDALNPRQLWLLVILIAALSEVGYIAVRALGEARGSAVTGLVGGLASSTAVTLTFARRSREERAMAEPLAAGIMLSWLVMFARIAVMILVVYRPLLSDLALPLGVMATVSLGAAAVFLRRGASDEAPQPGGVPLRNPFSLTAAIRFGLFFAGVLLLVALVRRYFPSEGLYLVAGLAGLTDVDAITLSMARMAQEGGGLAVAAGAVTIAAVSNTVVKGGLAGTLGSRDLARRIVPAAVLVLLAGLGAAFIL